MSVDTKSEAEASSEVPEMELGWASRIMVESLRKQGWLVAIERRAALVTDLEEQTVALRHCMAGLEQELANARETLLRDTSRLQERIDHLTRELDVRAHALASAMTSQERLERELVDHAATTLALRTTLAGREHQLGRTTHELEEAKKSIARVLRKLDEVTGALATREARIAQLEEALVEALTAREAEEPSPDERVANLMMELEERDALVGELERAIAAQRMAIAKRDAALATLGASPVSVR